MCDAIALERDLEGLLRAIRLPAGVVLQVGGGVTHDNALGLYKAGPRLLVAHEATFAREDFPRAYRRLVQALV